MEVLLEAESVVLGSDLAIRSAWNVIEFECKKVLREDDIKNLLIYTSWEAVSAQASLDSRIASTLSQDDRPRKVMEMLSNTCKQSDVFMPQFMQMLRKSPFCPHILWGLMLRIVKELCLNGLPTLRTVVAKLQPLLEEQFRKLGSLWNLLKSVPEASVDEIFLPTFADFIIKFVLEILRGAEDNDFENQPEIIWNLITERHSAALVQTETLIHDMNQRVTNDGIRKKQRQKQQDQTSSQALWQLDTLNLGRQPSDNPLHMDQQTVRTNMPPKNAHFCGRDTLIDKIDDILQFQPQHIELRSLALWGLGGIGKTQLAIAYGRRRLAEGTKIVLWVSCETELSRSESFTEIAILLNIDGSSNGNHDQNRTGVLKYLKRCSQPWLVILDNIDLHNTEQSGTSIHSYYPTGDYGSVLATSRYRGVALGLIAHDISMPVFKDDEGSLLLQKLVKRDAYTEVEIDASRNLSRLLGGLPLAIYIMAGFIFRRNLSIAVFLKMYESNYESNYSKILRTTSQAKASSTSSYPHTLETCWEIAFQYINEQSSDAPTVLGIMAFLAPEEIPVDIFTSVDLAQYDDVLEFEQGQDDFDIQITCGVLVDCSLITGSPERSFTIHRLLQAIYRERMSETRQYNAFRAGAKLLLERFPKQVSGNSLRNVWEPCRKYIQHVLSLALRFTHSNFQPRHVGDFEAFAELLSNAAWYLNEVGQMNECMTLVNAGLKACEDKQSILYAHLAATAGSVESERGHPVSARYYLEAATRIRESKLAPDDTELAGIWSSYANMLLTEWASDSAPDEAIALYDKAIAIDEKQSDPYTKNCALFIRFINRGVAKAAKGLHQAGIDDIQTARKHAIAALGPDSHWEADCDYNAGFAYLEMDDLESAEKVYQRCLTVYSSENSLHPACIATEYKLACILIRRKEFSRAVASLRKVKLSYEIIAAQKGDQGDVARAGRRLAEALEGVGEHEEALTLREGAEKIRKEIQGLRYHLLPDTEKSYSLLVSMNYW